jgi:hypothetical protein
MTGSVRRYVTSVRERHCVVRQARRIAQWARYVAHARAPASEREMTLVAHREYGGISV